MWDYKPWDNDGAADWYGDLMDNTKLRDAWLEGIKEDPIDSPDVVRAAAGLFIILGRIYIWPIDNYDSFTADSDTKYRQAIFIFIAIISLVFTIMLYLDSTEWLLPAIVSYAILGLLIYWGNMRIFFVPYNNGKNSSNDT